MVPDLRTLDRYPWTGHSALLGTVPARLAGHRRPSSPSSAATRAGRPPAYRAFVADGIPQGRRPELQGGGLVRSLGGWAAVTATRRTGAPVQADARILGSGEFVAAVLREVPDLPVGGMPSRVTLETLAARLAARLGVAVPALFGGTQTRPAVTARQLLAYVWVEVLGRRASDLARALGQTRGNISLAAQRGAVHAARWQTEIPRWCR